MAQKVQNSPLFALPPEVQDHIYSYMIHVPNSWHHRTGNKNIIDLRPLQICRQIRKQTWARLCSKEWIRFTVQVPTGSTPFRQRDLWDTTLEYIPVDKFSDSESTHLDRSSIIHVRLEQVNSSNGGIESIGSTCRGFIPYTDVIYGVFCSRLKTCVLSSSTLTIGISARIRKDRNSLMDRYLLPLSTVRGAESVVFENLMSMPIYSHLSQKMQELRRTSYDFQTISLSYLEEAQYHLCQRDEAVCKHHGEVHLTLARAFLAEGRGFMDTYHAALNANQWRMNHPANVVVNDIFIDSMLQHVRVLCAFLQTACNPVEGEKEGFPEVAHRVEGIKDSLRTTRALGDMTNAHRALMYALEAKILKIFLDFVEATSNPENLLHSPEPSSGQEYSLQSPSSTELKHMSSAIAGTQQLLTCRPLQLLVASHFTSHWQSTHSRPD